MSSGLWKIIETEIGQPFPCHLDSSDLCYYAEDYISGGGFLASQGNDLISNFKKPVCRKDKPEWSYKERAIITFAKTLSEIIPNNNDFTVTCIPTSKATDDIEYDPRFEETFSLLKEISPVIIIDYPIKLKQTIESSHIGGERNVQFFLEQYEWVGLKKLTKHIILVDDVISSGSHFKACKNIISRHHKKISVYGIFWAKTINS